MLFGCYMGRSHLRKLPLHPLKDNARPSQPRCIIVSLVLSHEFTLPGDAALLFLNVLSG